MISRHFIMRRACVPHLKCQHHYYFKNLMISNTCHESIQVAIKNTGANNLHND
jgi:hypothetical protein